MAYCDGKPEVVAFLFPFEQLVLRREPGNPYDRRAIKVLTLQGVKLAYVPRQDNKVIAALMDAGTPVAAVLHEVRSEEWPYRCLRMDLWGNLPRQI